MPSIDEHGLTAVERTILSTLMNSTRPLDLRTLAARLRMEAGTPLTEPSMSSGRQPWARGEGCREAVVSCSRAGGMRAGRSLMRASRGMDHGFWWGRVLLLRTERAALRVGRRLP